MKRFTSECPRCGTPNTLNVDMYFDEDDIIVSNVMGPWSDETSGFIDPNKNEEGDLICPVCGTKIYVSAIADITLIAQSLYVPKTFNTWGDEQLAKASTKPWYKTGFYIDSVDVAFMGYTSGKYWNGWECPEFKKTTVESMIRIYCTDDSFKGWYDEENDCFLFWDVNNDEPEVFPGADYIVNGEKERLYSVGSWSWCWNSLPSKYHNTEANQVIVYLESNDNSELRHDAAMQKWSEEEGPLSKPQHRKPTLSSILDGYDEPDLEGQLDTLEAMTGTVRSTTGRIVLDKSPIEEVEKSEGSNEEY